MLIFVTQRGHEIRRYCDTEILRYRDTERERQEVRQRELERDAEDLQGRKKGGFYKESVLCSHSALKHQETDPGQIVFYNLRK